jgi:hypothetical protein
MNLATQRDAVLTLTDDEIVAVAIAGSTFYAGDLPTVDSDSEQALLQASLRGQRSLVARGWIDEDGELAADLTVARSAAGASSFINVFLGDEELNRIDWSLATSLYARDLGWVIEGVEGIGLHRFAAVTEHEAREALNTLVDAALTNVANQPAPDGVWLVVSVLRDRASDLLAARPGACRTASIDEGRLSPWSAMEPEDVQAWIDAGLASVGA